MVNTPIHTRSRACQNRLKQNRRRTTVVRSPSVATCAIMTSSHSRPELTWQPCVPTSVKNADRNALCVGP